MLTYGDYHTRYSKLIVCSMSRSYFVNTTVKCSMPLDIPTRSASSNNTHMPHPCQGP